MFAFNVNTFCDVHEPVWPYMAKSGREVSQASFFRAASVVESLPSTTNRIDDALQALGNDHGKLGPGPNLESSNSGITDISPQPHTTWSETTCSSADGL